MNPVEINHEMLLGILALQMNFIDRHELITAFDSWTTDKSRGLGSILVERQAVTPADLELLTRVVEKFCAKFGDDTASSLATLDPPEDVRDALDELGDPDLTASIRLAGHGDDAFATQAPVTQSAPCGARRFRAVRRHAKGGLGEVWLAMDEELKREVALKELRKKHASSSENRERFLLEAEVTGGLEHPGIVPVYGLGTYSDGRPYYAMRFIRGESLKAAIDVHYASRGAEAKTPGTMHLELRQLLGNLIQVCRTIEYAHSRGVLHRDLKPANIMLGKYGETLVVDWGLAKAEGQPHLPSGETPWKSGSMSSSSLQTQAGSAIGTPAYMSPEQAEGRLDDLGPATDIYSLGATLYHIITGRPPVEANSLATMIEIVCAGKIAPPRSVRPGIPAALEAICLKALRVQPAERYPSAMALADDLEHWLADEPIAAWREPRTATLARWSRRHRSAAVAGVFACLMLVAAVGWSYVAGVRRDLAEAHARELEREADRALHALEDVFNVVSANDVVDEKSLQPVRNTLLHYYQEYLDQRSFDTARQLDLAQANEKMAQMTRLVGTKLEALVFLEHAQRIYGDLARTAPQLNNDYEARRAHSLVDQGVLLHELGRNTESDACLAESLKILEPLTERGSEHDDWQTWLADAYHNRGVLRQDAGERLEAERLLKLGRDKRQELLQRHPHDRALQRDLAISFGFLGDVELELGQDVQAKLAYDESERHRLELVESNSRDPEARFQLARSYENTASYFRRRRNTPPDKHQDKQHDFEQARDYLIKSRKVRQALVLEKPDNSHYQQDLAWADLALGEVALELAAWDEASEALRKAEVAFAELLDDDPDDNASREGRAAARISSSTALLAKAELKGDPQAAGVLRLESLKMAESALADLRLMKGDQTSNVLYELSLVDALRAELIPDSSEAYRSNAVDLLEQAIAKGFNDWSRLTRERVFQGLRSYPRFAALLNRLD